MKNKFLLFLLLFGAVFAYAGNRDGLTPHWTTGGIMPSYTGGGNMTFAAAIHIDGVPVTNPNYELAAFMEWDSEAVLSQMLGSFPVTSGGSYMLSPSGAYVYGLVPFGYEEEDNSPNGNRLTFKIFDHESGEILDLVSPSIIYNVNWVLASYEHPLVLNFYTNTTKWEKVTDASTLAEGDVLLIVGAEDDYAMSEDQAKNDRGSWPVTHTANGSLTWDEPDFSNEEFGPQEVILYQTNGDNWGLFAGQGFLYAASNTKDWLRSQKSITDNSSWSVDIDADGVATIVSQGSFSHNVLTLDDESFVCSTDEISPICLYRKVMAGDEPVVHTITVGDVVNGTVTPSLTEAVAETEITVTVEPAEGYHLATLTYTYNETTVDIAETMAFVMPDADVTINATFAQTVYNITVAETENGTVTAPATAMYLDQVSVEVTPAEGYELATLTYVYGDNEPVDIMETKIFTMPAADVTINATFAQTVYTITVAEVENGTVTAPATAVFGEQITVEVTAAEGYELATLTYVYGDNEPIDIKEAKAFTMPAADVTINATFAQTVYTITIGEMENGTVTAPATAVFGEEITVEVVPAEGYMLATLTYVYGDNEPVDIKEAKAFTMPAADVTINATFELIPPTVYTITVAEVENGTVVASAEESIAGEMITVTATPAEGYQLATLTYTYGENIVDIMEAQAFEMPAANVVINATFELIPPTVYTITVAEVENGTVVASAEESIAGEMITVTATPAEGYELATLTYTYDENVVDIMEAQAFEMPEANVVINATFELIPPTVYTITVAEVENGTVVASAEESIAGETITVTVTPAMGYELATLTYTYGENTVDIMEAQSFVMPEANVVINATFAQQEFTISLTILPVEGGEVVFSAEAPYHYGDEVTLTAVPALGYEFLNWEVDGEEIEGATYTLTIASNVALVANFEQQFYLISVEADPAEGGDVDMIGDDTFYGTEMTLVADPNEGWSFVNWTLGEEVVSTDAEYPIVITGDAEYVAHFVLINYTIAVEAGLGGEASITDGPYHFGDEVTVIATPNEGYNFLNWTVNGQEVSVEPTYSFNVTEDMTLVANFVEAIIPVYTITAVADPIEGGTITGAGSFTEGTEVTLTATANEAYTFVGWTKNGEEYPGEATIVFIAEGDADFVALFEMKTYTITLTAGEGGTVAIDPEQETYNHGTQVTVTAMPAEGYQFAGWTGFETEITEATYSFNVTADMILVANFELIPVIPTYTVTVVVNPENAGTVEGAGTFEEGTEITLVATAAEGYEFVNFTIGTEVVEMPYTVTADVEIVANFIEVVVPPTEYTVTVVVNPENAGTVEGAGTFEEGTEITLVATAAEGYEFVNFTIGTEVVEMPYTVTADVEIVANFIEVVVPPTEYTVTVVVNPENAGTVEGAGTYAEGTEITLVATAAEGYEFINFTIGTEVVEMPYTVTADVEIVANFEEIPVVEIYNITVAEVENGTITAPATAEAGETVTVVATPNPMFSLVSLYYYTTDPEDVTEIDLATKQFVMPAADVTIGGEFAMIEGKGDVNLDGIVNIVDVVAVLNYVLDKDPQPFSFEQADMNEDGNIEINDALAINAMILGLKADCEDTEVTYQVVDGELFIDSDVALAGYQFRLSAEPASINMAGFTAMGNWSNGEYILLVFNLNGEKESGIYSVLDLGDASLNSIVMSTKEGCRVRGKVGIVSVASFDERDYSVYPVPANTEVTVAGPEITTVEVFNLAGQRVMTVNVNSDSTVVNVSSLSTGSYLFRINTANGFTTKNVVVVR